MKYKKHRRAFLGVILAAILIDLSYDILALKQSYTTDETSRQVMLSYQILGEISDASMAVKSNILFHLSGNHNLEIGAVQSFVEHFKSLQALSSDDSDFQSRLKEHAALTALPPAQLSAQLIADSHALDQTFAELRNVAQQKLAVRINNDDIANAQSRNEIIFASILDFLLLSGAIFLWTSFDRARKRNEATLEAAKALAQQSVADLTILIEKRTKELRTTIHDLKNPLGSIKGFSDLIHNEANNSLTVTEMSEVLQRLSRHTLTLVNSLLESEAQKTPLSRMPRLVSVVGYIEDVCLALKPQYQAKNQIVKIHHDGSVAEIFGDPKKLWDMFMNLIENASKFSPLNGSIVIESRVSANSLVVEINDDGHGFSPADRQNAFREFETLSAKATSGEKSTGLGLFSANNTIKAHNGTIEIRNSKVTKGACVVVWLPLYFEKALME